MDKDVFFDELREADVFGRSLSQEQVDGINMILLLMGDQPLAYLAYALATAYGESSMTMQPIEENLRYSARRIPEVFSLSRLKGYKPSQLAGNPELLANVVYGVDWLGNDQWGDGWKYRGRGIVQLTGKVNYRKMSKLVGIDLVADPDQAMKPSVSVLALEQGIVHGLYTGKKASDYLPAKGKATHQQFRNARRIINGTFQSHRYASWAIQFQTALATAGYTPKKLQPPRVTPQPRPTSLLIRILKGAFSIWSKR